MLVALLFGIPASGSLLAQDRDERARRVLDVLAVESGQTVADIGCGSGWLSAAIAKSVGETGRVYAVEINADRLERVEELEITNIVPVLSLPDDVSLPENCLDVAMLHDVASHVEKRGRPRFYESIVRALKPGGVLVIFGPHGEARAMLTELRIYGWRPEGSKELLALPDDDLDARLKAGIRFQYRPEHRYY